MSELAPLAAELASELRARIDAPEAGDFEKLEQGDQPDRPEFLKDPEYRSLLKAMEFDPRSADELVRLTGLPVQSVSSMLLMLETQWDGDHSQQRSLQQEKLTTHP